jgi:hypothetical protein
MAANSSAHPARAGFNQSGGAYFYIAADLTIAHINKINVAASGSGGAAVAPTFTAVAATDAAIGIGAGDVVAGKLLKDMGKSVVSSGRVFRRFQSVGSGATKFNSTLGVNGAATSAANSGYGTFYLEVGREGQGAAVPAPVVRYF